MIEIYIHLRYTWAFYGSHQLRLMLCFGAVSIPTPPALQTVFLPRYILRFHRRTSHNVNYEFNFLSITTQFTFNVGGVDFLYSIPTK